MSNRTHQNALFDSHKPLPPLYPFTAQVAQAYSDRMTCDLALPPFVAYTSSTPPQPTYYNVPVLVKGGIDPTTNEIWGEMETPQVNDIVIAAYVGPYKERVIILGTIYPFLLSYFQSNQTPVNSSNKQFSLKLLVADELKTFRRIFKSGTTLEVGENGTVTVETPSGSYIQMNESGDSITIQASGSNVNINTGSGGTVNLNGTGDYVTKFNELSSAVSSFNTTLNNHTHAVTTAPGTTSAPNGGLGGLSLEISSAQSSKVQVGG